MSLKLTIFACLFANFLFSYRGYEAKPATSKNPSIVDVIVNDANIYNSTRETAKQSKYLEECRKIDFPEKFVNLTEKNLNEFLCLAIYDGFVKIGHQDNCTEGNRKEEDKSVLNNQTMFERAVEATLKSYGNPWNFCGNLKNLSLPVFNRTKHFIAQLESKFDTRGHCTPTCSGSNDEINPLCVILEIIDQQLHVTVANSKSVKKDIKLIPAESSHDQNIDHPATAKSGGDDPNIDSNSHITINTETKPVTTNKVEANKSKTSETASKAMNDKKKVSSNTSAPKSNSEISNHRDEVTKSKAKPDKSSIKDQVAETEQNPLDVSDTPKENGVVVNSGKTTPFPEKTLNEDEADQSPEYNAGTGDNEQISELDSEDSIDDIPDSITKQNPQLEVDPIDQKANKPRLTSMQTEDDSHFFGYFTIIGLIGISACLIYHHKQKILAMIVEGRRSRGGRGRKRPSTANYRKLDCNLEEAVTSQCNSNVTHVIY